MGATDGRSVQHRRLVERSVASIRAALAVQSRSLKPLGLYIDPLFLRCSKAGSSNAMHDAVDDLPFSLFSTLTLGRCSTTCPRRRSHFTPLVQTLRGAAGPSTLAFLSPDAEASCSRRGGM